jgi:hypothetical protein
MNLFRWIVLALVVACSSCASMNQPDTGDMTVKLDSIPTECLVGTRLFVEVDGSHGGSFHRNVTIENGGCTIQPYTGPEAGGDPAKKFQPGETITVKITFLALSIDCQEYLENQVFHCQIVKRQTHFKSGDINAVSPTSKEWKFRFDDLKRVP